MNNKNHPLSKLQDSLKGRFNLVLINLLVLALFCSKVTPNNFPLPKPHPVPDVPVTDLDGNTYQTVKIGSQIWMAENLRTSKFGDGTSIPHVADSLAWSGLSSPGYCYYNNTTSADSIKKFGALYNWYTVDSKILGFPGWHVPSEADWDTMEAYLTNNGYNYDETIGGEKIAKSLAAQTDWQASSNVGAVGNDLTLNNTSGFSGLPAGARNYQGIFGLISNDGYWWNSAAYSASLGDTRILSNWALLFNHNCGPKSSGFSVRLVKD